MSYVPPYSLLIRWLNEQAESSNGRLLILYDELLDVLRAYIAGVPIDETWYLASYPGVARFIARSATTTSRSHFINHGYFEGRRPHAAGWKGYSDLVPYEQLKPLLRIRHSRGRLYAEVSRDEILSLVRQFLAAIPVDVAWYFRSRSAPDGVDANAASEHFVAAGYFEGCLPSDVIVDEDWYLARYEHVREGLTRGVATDARDHFLKLGYYEGCRPTPP
jgi:hypothetical protein